MATVDQHSQLDAARSAEINQRVQRRAYRAAGVEDVIHQHDTQVVHTKRDVRTADLRPRPVTADIVTVQGNVDDPAWQCDPLHPLDLRREPPRQMHATGVYADEGKVIGVPVLLQDLVGNARERPLNGYVVQDYSCRFHAHPEW